MRFQIFQLPWWKEWLPPTLPDRTFFTPEAASTQEATKARLVPKNVRDIGERASPNSCSCSCTTSTSTSPVARILFNTPE